MNKEQQSLLWACLSKDAREDIKESYRYKCSDKAYNAGVNETLGALFDHHNLTSDTEPEEVLMVERKKVQEYYSESENDSLVTDITEYDRGYALGVCDALGYLFGDKCLHDKEEPKPKFKVGDKVRVVNIPSRVMNGDIVTIDELPTKLEPCYRVKYDTGVWNLLLEEYLEPYTEPSNVSTNDTKDDTKESVNLSQETANCDKSEDNQLKGNMEEKELNSWDEDFKRMNELFNKMQKTVAKIYDSYGKMCVAVEKLKRL